LSTAVLILTLNEIDGIKEILPQIDKSWAEEIVVIDGGSTDGTVEEAKKMGFSVIIQKNPGHGDAIVTGVNATKSANILIFGPDGNHEPSEIPRLIEKIKEGYDQVLISRFGKGSKNLDAVGFKGKLIDYFGNKMFAFLVNVFFGGHWTDSLNESRIITRKAFDELNFNSLQMGSTQLMSIRGLKRQQKICELIGNEGPRIGGKRKMRPLHVGSDLSKQILSEFFNWDNFKKENF
jgi:glycosyltransferase involved in cell wall biosynthesis